MSDWDEGGSRHQLSPSELVSSTMHEARRPLSLLRGYVEMLRDGSLGGLTAAQRRAVQRIDEKTAELAHMLEGIETAARLESGTVDLGEVDLGHAAERAASRAGAKAELRGAHLALDLNGGGTVLAHADRALVARILDNLVDNALTYADGPPDVCLRVRDEGGPVIQVVDHGIGISKSAASRIFERSYREHPNDDRWPGWGLGLHLCARAATSMGGQLLLEGSEVGGGTCFRLELQPAQPVRRPAR